MELKAISTKELLGRALFNSNRGKWSEALVFADEAVKREPDNFLANKRYGLIKWYMDEQEAAIASLNKCVALKPTFGSGYYNLACFYALRDEKELMLSHLEKAIENDFPSQFKELARKDENFEEFLEDEDFVKLVGDEDDDTNPLQDIIKGEDFDKISDTLLKIGDEIPLKAISWDGYGDGLDFNRAIRDNGDKLSYEALLHLFKIIIPGQVDALGEMWDLLAALYAKKPKEFAPLLLDEWKNRSLNIPNEDAKENDRHILRFIADLPALDVVPMVLWAIDLKGKEVLPDYDELSSLIIDGLPKAHDLRTQLIAKLDACMHEQANASDAFEVKEKRVVLALPAPDVYIFGGEGFDISIKYAKHIHPDIALKSINFLSIQSSRPEIKAIARQSLPRLIELALDTSLTEDQRYSAIKLVKELGGKEELLQLAPVLIGDNNYLIDFVAEAFIENELSAPELDQAVDALLSTIVAEEDADKLYDLLGIIYWCKHPNIVPLLLSLLDHEDKSVKSRAMSGLSINKAKEAVDPLIKLMFEDKGYWVLSTTSALKSIDTEACRAVLSDRNNYEQLLDVAKKVEKVLEYNIPSRADIFAILALTNFKVEGIFDDLFHLFTTLNGNMDVDVHVTNGIRDVVKPTDLKAFVALGLDRYKGSKKSGRYYVQICRSIARNANSPADASVLAELVELLKAHPVEDIQAFAKDIDHDGVGPKDDEFQLEEAFVKSVFEAFKTVGPEAKFLASALFQYKEVEDEDAFMARMIAKQNGIK